MKTSSQAWLRCFAGPTGTRTFIADSSEDFEQAGRAHAARNAHRDHRILDAPAPGFEQHVPCQARTGHAEGMADGDRAAVDVEQLVRNAKPVTAMDRLRGERFVQLPQADVFDLE